MPPLEPMDNKYGVSCSGRGVSILLPAQNMSKEDVLGLICWLALITQTEIPAIEQGMKEIES